MRGSSDDHGKGRSRGPLARGFDQLTVVLFVVAAVTMTVVVYRLGTAQASERLGCGIVAVVNRSLDLSQPCR